MPATPGMTDAFCVTVVRPPHDLVLTVPEPGGGNRVSWEFQLEPLNQARTRLIVRGRISRHWPGSIRERARPAGPFIFIERLYIIGAYPAATYAGCRRFWPLRDASPHASRHQAPCGGAMLTANVRSCAMSRTAISRG